MDGQRALKLLNHTLSFTSLKAYYVCPRQFEMKYLSKPPLPWVFKPAMAIGGVVHKSLAQTLRFQRDKRPPATIEAHVDRYLRQEPYPIDGGDELRALHRPEIVGHVQSALSLLPPDAEVLDVEESFKYPFTLTSLATGMALMSRVDLIIRHGADGVVDHIDFKTGSYGGDAWQNFIARLTVAHGREVRGDQLRTVNILTKSLEYKVIPLDPSEKHHTWETIKQAIRELAEDSAWHARPDPWSCRFCDFRPACSWAAPLPDDHDC